MAGCNCDLLAQDTQLCPWTTVPCLSSFLKPPLPAQSELQVGPQIYILTSSSSGFYHQVLTEGDESTYTAQEEDRWGRMPPQRTNRNQLLPLSKSIRYAIFHLSNWQRLKPSIARHTGDEISFCTLWRECEPAHYQRTTWQLLSWALTFFTPLTTAIPLLGTYRKPVVLALAVHCLLIRLLGPLPGMSENKICQSGDFHFNTYIIWGYSF